jgi:hypothetical protein
LGQYTVGRGGDGVFHLHRFQPYQRLSSRHGIAEAGAESDHRSGHRRQQGPLLDHRVRLREAGQGGQRDVAMHRVDVHCIAVAGHPVTRGDTGIGQYHLLRGCREQADLGVVGQIQPGAGESIAHPVLPTIGVPKVLLLIAGGHIAKPAGNLGEHGCR